MQKIGIFWFYQQQVFGRSCELAAGLSSGLGVMDSPDTHVDLWAQLSAPFPALRQLEYDEVPRGRVVYIERQQCFVVYMDRAIHHQLGKQAVRQFFGLEESAVRWRTDLHYTTNRQCLARLFEEPD